MSGKKPEENQSEETPKPKPTTPPEQEQERTPAPPETPKVETPKQQDVDEDEQEPEHEPKWLKSRLDRAREQGARDKEQEMRSEIDELKTQVAGLVSETLSEKRKRVATEVGVPEKYVTGENEEDMRTSAQEFLEDSKKLLEASQKQRRGYVPTQGTSDPEQEGLSPYDVGRERAQARFDKTKQAATAS